MNTDTWPSPEMDMTGKVATVAGGAGVICFAAFFQNKKHGFIK